MPEDICFYNVLSYSLFFAVSLSCVVLWEPKKQTAHVLTYILFPVVFTDLLRQKGSGSLVQNTFVV